MSKLGTKKFIDRLTQTPSDPLRVLRVPSVRNQFHRLLELCQSDDLEQNKDEINELAELLTDAITPTPTE